MMYLTIMCISITLQLTTAVLALRLIRLPNTRMICIPIALAMTLIAVRRIIPLVKYAGTGVAGRIDMLEVVMTIAVSLLMIWGILAIEPLLLTLTRAKDAWKSGRCWPLASR